MIVPLTSMNFQKLSCSALLVAAAVLSGCAALIDTDTKFREWRGSEIVAGKGGAIEVHDGYEFWSHGVPDKPFKVIGVIEQSKKVGFTDELMFGNFNRGEIIKILRAKGADGVVTIDSAQYTSGVSLNHGTGGLSAQRSERSLMAVFNYVEQESSTEQPEQ